jgi:UDP-N-acetylmuramoyl-L-alanine---L-glutamate ligase
MPILRGARHIGIWGFGREGQAAYHFLQNNYPDVEITILNDTPLPRADQEERRLRVIHGDEVPSAIRSGVFDIIVKSPGISLYRQEIIDAKEAGVRFTSITNLWFEQNQDARTIVVTGTKGKSTTSRLLHHLLKMSGLDVALMGNVGIPMLGSPAGRDWTVIELSSYQVADLAYGPTIAVVTNLYPEHAPWHGSVEQYFRDKLRIVSLGERTLVVCNYADMRLRQKLGDKTGVQWFNANRGFSVHDGRLYFDDRAVDYSGFPLKGDHNLANLAAACTVADIIGMTGYRDAVDTRSFQQLPHRLEEFRVGPGLLCIDDSISTVPEATLAALEAYPDRNTALLLGGWDRGQDYSALFAMLRSSRVKCLILLPPNGERIRAEISRISMPFCTVKVNNLEHAIMEAFKRVTRDDLVLLSPAAPSFGEFHNFEERGQAFKALCARHAALIEAGSATGRTV